MVIYFRAYEYFFAFLIWQGVTQLLVLIHYRMNIQPRRDDQIFRLPIMN